MLPIKNRSWFTEKMIWHHDIVRETDWFSNFLWRGSISDQIHESGIIFTAPKNARSNICSKRDPKLFHSRLYWRTSWNHKKPPDIAAIVVVRDRNSQTRSDQESWGDVEPFKMKDGQIEATMHCRSRHANQWIFWCLYEPTIWPGMNCILYLNEINIVKAHIIESKTHTGRSRDSPVLTMPMVDFYVISLYDSPIACCPS
jgi:hypothetical protein